MDGSFVPIYQKLTDHYTESILRQDYPPGGKIDSINQIMIRHKVSRETAKLVLKKLTEEGLIISKQGKGSFVVHHQKTQNIWGMIIPFYSSNMEHLIFNLDNEANRRNKQLSYYIGYNNPDEEKRLVSKMILEGYEAIIVVPNHDESKTAGYYRNLIQANTQVILTDHTMSGSYFKYVIQSYDLGVKRAIDYLITNNANNLLMVKNETWKGRNLLDELMEQTFRTIVTRDYPDRESYIASNLKELSHGFLKNNKIGGVLCCSDIDAIKILGRLKQWDIAIPGKVRLINYGNTELTELYDPQISVIDCLYEDMAAKTALLIDKGKEAGPFEQYIIEPKLIVRGT